MSYAWQAIRTNQAASVTGWGEAQKRNNALIINDYFHAQNGWTVNAVSAMLGNMELESYINPGQTQIGYSLADPAGGFGLVQWTPRTKYSNWAGADWETNYDKQLERLKQEWLTGLDGQWIPTATDGYMTFDQFAHSTGNPGDLAMTFERSYERGTPFEAQRRANANKWYQYLTGETPPVPVTGNLPVWLLFKIRWDGGTRRK